jgi:hypothetical protein
MAEVIHDDKMLIYFFQYSLTGSALSWYMRLEARQHWDQEVGGPGRCFLKAIQV